MSWLPIESAPKDGTAILAFWKGCDWPETGSNYAVAMFDRGEWRPADDIDDAEWAEPSHWLPLPKPPGEAEPLWELPPADWFADQLCEARNRWSAEHESAWLETDDNHPDQWIGAYLRAALTGETDDRWELTEAGRAMRGGK